MDAIVAPPLAELQRCAQLGLLALQLLGLAHEAAPDDQQPRTDAAAPLDEAVGRRRGGARREPRQPRERRRHLRPAPFQLLGEGVGHYVSLYSGPEPPSGGVNRPPLAVIAPHWTQFDGASSTSAVPSPPVLTS